MEANIHLSECSVLFQAQWPFNFPNATTKWNISLRENESILTV
jgi:hypothetical protein